MTSTNPPRLLVSVRNLAEATSALAGGADIIDIKEPAHGSLGMAPLNIIDPIVRTFSSTIPMTAALGELVEQESIPIVSASQLASLWIVKVGTSHIDQPVRAFDRFRRWADSLIGVTSLIPAIYADYRRCGGIDPITGIEWALQTDSPALLIDTFIKDGQRLTDRIDRAELEEIASACRTHGILLALAGSLRADEIESLHDIQPAIWAVRGSVCHAGDRSGSVAADLVRSLAQQIKRPPTSTPART